MQDTGCDQRSEIINQRNPTGAASLIEQETPAAQAVHGSIPHHDREAFALRYRRTNGAV